MQIVIDIDDDLYTRLFDNGDEYVADMRRACVAIRKGTPLPKGHGDLVDRGTYCSALEEKIKNWDVTSEEVHDKIHGIAIAHNICNKLIPIVKADKAESED